MSVSGTSVGSKASAYTNSLTSQYGLQTHSIKKIAQSIGSSEEETNYADEDAYDENNIRKMIQDNFEDKNYVRELIKNLTAEELFRIFDADNSGLISFEEFRRMLPALSIDISDAKAFRYFNICDTDGSGEIDVDEFKVALFTCDPTSGNPVGYQPSKFLSPLDAFETFDEDRSGFIDEDEYYFAMNYLGLEIPERQLEKMFNKYDYNRTGSIDYYEFREIYLKLCDINRELEDRGVEVPIFSQRSFLEEMLREIYVEEEKRERRAIAEARRYKEWMSRVKELKELFRRAHWRAYQELRSCLDAAGQVYVFGSGSQGQYGSNTVDRLMSKTYEFYLFHKVMELWEDRVRPEQLIHKLRLERRAQEQESKVEKIRNNKLSLDERAKLLNDIIEESADEEMKYILDPYREALHSKFRGLNVSLNTSALCGRRVHHVTISDSVIFAVADSG